MESISMLEMRKNAEAIINRLQAGERFALTYRGNVVAHLEPISSRPFPVDDPFFTLSDLDGGKDESLTNDEMDRLIYGE